MALFEREAGELNQHVEGDEPLRDGPAQGHEDPNYPADGSQEPACLRGMHHILEPKLNSGAELGGG